MLVQEDLEQVIKTVTDRIGGIMDQYKAGLVMAFRCSASGLFYPADYIKGWGTKFGIGLGPHVCSESLQTDYTTAPPEINGAIRSINQIMHPMYSSCAQMDLVMISPVEMAAARAVPANGDELFEKRAPILRAKQLKNPLSRIKQMQVRFESIT